MEPARKRQRISPLSSPSYEGDILNLSQEDIQAMDELEARLSQSSSPPRRKPPSANASHKVERFRIIADALGRRESSSSPESNGDRRDGFWEGETAEPEGRSLSDFQPTFQRAANVQPYSDEPPEGVTEADYSAWFASAPLSPACFQSARVASSTDVHNAPSTGFVKASNKGFIIPSAAALADADARLKRWQDEDAENNAPMPASHSPVKQPSFTSGLAMSPQRPAFRALQNQYTPVTPTPTGFASPSILTANFLDPSRGKGKAKPFKSPLLNPAMCQRQSQMAFSHVGSPLNPIAQLSGSHNMACIQQQHSSTPSRTFTSSSSTAFMTPVKTGTSAGVTFRKTPAKFKTPFKPGMRPGEPGSVGLRAVTPTSWVDAVTNMASNKFSALESPRPRAKCAFFDLSKPPNRHTLASSGLLPQSYSSDDLNTLGINTHELSQMTPSLAQYYTFHTPSDIPAFVSTQTSSQLPTLGPTAAFEQLLERGCSLATKSWVENHWCLILWKLAGMVALEPEKERDPTTKRWCWKEVMRQLLYRYERELNGGSRPALRLISTQDAPASCPMVLCISNITWSEVTISEDGTPTEPHPELEVTDGWYRLRAQLDEPLVRAVRRGVIRIGRKIAVAGARLSSERKEPVEILEAYNSVKLILGGNSSHLAPWHAKLGFQQGPYMATLNSLTHDGGPVAVMDLVVTKMYPIAYIEFLENEDGKKYREGPRNEAQEVAAMNKWTRLREVEASKLKAELEKRVARYESYAERLERKAGQHFRPTEDASPPDCIDGLYDELEDSDMAIAMIARLSAQDAGWLARIIRERIVKDRDAATEEMERELNSICPPREVRSFRVLEVQDACTRRRPANRTAQLTVWDVLKLTFTEGGEPGLFQVGQRFLVTNLIPSQQSAWMDREPGSMVYLSTRKDTRWTMMKGVRQ